MNERLSRSWGNRNIEIRAIHRNKLNALNYKGCWGGDTAAACFENSRSGTPPPASPLNPFDRLPPPLPDAGKSHALELFVALQGSLAWPFIFDLRVLGQSRNFPDRIRDTPVGARVS